MRSLLSITLLLACNSNATGVESVVNKDAAKNSAPTQDAAPAASESTATPAPAVETATLVEQARAHTGQLAKRLQAKLGAAMADGGPTAAIAVCNTAAPEIAGELSRDGWAIGRTASRFRNPDNAPDAWETAALTEFDRRLAAGEPSDQLEHHDVVELDGRATFRYTKAIVTGPLCLACHGDSLDATVTAKLDELYPQDQARGFAAGSLRGAFSVSKPL